MPVVIDIGSKYVKILKGSMTKKGTVLITNCIIEEVPEGAMENGYIKSQTDLVLFLRNLIGKAGFEKSQCYVTVRSSDIVAREITVPELSPFKLKKVINNEIAAVFGNTSDYYIDYFVSEKVLVDYKSLLKITAYAVPKGLVFSYYETLSMIGLKPIAFDVHRNSIHKLFDKNVLINNASVAEKVMVFVDLGASYMDLDLVIEGNTVFKRSVPIGDELNTDDDFGSGFTQDYDTNSDNNEYNSYLSSEMSMNDYLYSDGSDNSSVTPLFAKVNEELYKMLQYAVSRESGKSVTNVYLYGGNSRTQGLDQYLSASLDVPVEKIISVSNIETALELNVADIAAAAGSIIRK
jgi:type IV pilus assembly protein PilM